MHRLISLFILMLLIAAGLVVRVAIGDPAPATSPASGMMQYSGVLADGSGVTIALQPPAVQIRFANQWIVSDATATTDAGGISFAGEGTAGDRTLAVSGSVKGDAGTMEVKVGVGLGATTSHVSLKKDGEQK